MSHAFYREESFGRARGCPSLSAHLRKDNWSSSIYLETRRNLADRSHVLRKMGQERSLNPRWHHRPGIPGLRPDSFAVGEEEMTMLKTLYLFFSCNMRLNLILSQAKDQTKANNEMDRRGVPQRQVSRQGPRGWRPMVLPTFRQYRVLQNIPGPATIWYVIHTRQTYSSSAFSFTSCFFFQVSIVAPNITF